MSEPIQTTAEPAERTLLDAARGVCALTFIEARAAADHGRRLLYCEADALNPCWDGRADDVLGQHWGGGPACAPCRLRAAIAAAEAPR